MKRMSEELENYVDEALNDGDQEKWENGELGNDAKYCKKLPAEETEAIHRARSKSHPTSIRLSRSLIEDLTRLAQENGMPYQTYLRMILLRHVKKMKTTRSDDGQHDG